ncbi:MAG: hemerythrin domain-containing protein [Oxalobacteraceae bacterium]|nr:hemerythrin domain-containing protein [Oxalobacteraceae bacterium]
MDHISDFMTSNHHACDELFASAEESVGNGNWAKGNSEFGAFLAAMKHHFTIEEEVLFPAFDEKTGMDMGPTFVMRSEHRQMEKVFGDMQQALAAQDSDGYLGLSETLLMLMQQHNMKEEQMLYRMMDQQLAEETPALLKQIGA